MAIISKIIEVDRAWWPAAEHVIIMVLLVLLVLSLLSGASVASNDLEIARTSQAEVVALQTRVAILQPKTPTPVPCYFMGHC